MSKQGEEKAFEDKPNTLTVAQFASIFPMRSVTETLDSMGCGTIRFNKTTKERLVYYQMMLSLFREYSQASAYRVVEAALKALEQTKRKSAPPTASALIQGLDRIDPAVFEILFQKFANPSGNISHPGMGFKGWTTVAIDGFTLAVEDTKPNRKFFGLPKNQHGESGLPQLRAVCLAEVGSHLIFKSAVGPFSDGEMTLAKRLIPFVQKDWMILGDRNFYSFDMYREISERGAALVVRLQKGMALNSEEQLADDSHIVTVYHSDDRNKVNGRKARVIQYKVLGSKKKNETIYLLTNILDPKVANAEELAKVYAERWEHEICLKELKTHLNVAKITLRGKNPDRVLREFWAMLMAHHAIRSLMLKAATTAKIDPDRLSFTHTVEIVQENIILERNAACSNCGHENRKGEEELVKDVLEKRLPDRRARSSERTSRSHHRKYNPTKGSKKTVKSKKRVKVKKGWDYRNPR